jgi:hypothetical protein
LVPYDMKYDWSGIPRARPVTHLEPWYPMISNMI